MDNLIIFIKNPQLGRVKTRLAATTGDGAALAIYQKLLAHTRSTALASGAGRWLFYSDFIDENDGWPPAFFEKKLQKGRDLGERMFNALLETSLSQPPGTGEKTFAIIGSDCAELTPAILDEAFSALKKSPFTIGPALDGGYYLIGMQRPSWAVFDKIEWSGETVFEKTMGKIAQKGATAHLLPALSDIDTEADWLQHARHLHGTAI